MRQGRLAVVMVLLATALVAITGDDAPAATVPAGFTDVAVLTGLNAPTAIAFAPNGRVYVAEKRGVVKVFPNATTNNATVFKDLQSRVHDLADRGMLGLAVDPRMGDGSGHDFVYVLYTRDAPPGQNPPVWDDDCPANPGLETDGCVVSGTLSRIPVNANGTGGAEQLLIDGQWCQQFSSHSVGHLAFGADGFLYVSGGEGASWENADWGQFGGSLSNPVTPKNPCGDPPGRVGVANTSPTGRGGALRAQSPRRPGGEARLLNGALLRVNPDTGAGVPGNPLYDAAAPSSNASRIVAHGFRNPFRFTMRPGTSEIWVADVGWGLYEEIDRVPNATTLANFGWPCLENQTHLSSYRDLDMCKALYADTTSTAPRNPYFAYLHGERINSNDTCAIDDGTVITGLAFYSGTRYPAAYRNALFFSDLAKNCILVMTAGANGLPDVSTARPFVDNADDPGPVDLETDPATGDLFYVSITGGSVHRIGYGSTNRPPVAKAGATPTSGNAPLTVQFNSNGTSDPDGDTLTYTWDTDGNGVYGDKSGPAPTATYADAGTFPARVRVVDPDGRVGVSAAVDIVVTNSAAPANTVRPTISGTLRVGSTVTGTPGTWTGNPTGFTYHWQNCAPTYVSVCVDIAGATGSSYVAQASDQGRQLRLRVRAQNAGGGSVIHSPRTTQVAAQTANAPPVPVIDAPALSTTWRAGDTINFSGHATDAEDGTEPASRLSWTVQIAHCPGGGCHLHPLISRAGVASGQVAAPSHEAPSHMIFTLTATDAIGQSASVTRTIEPQTANVTFRTSPSGLALTVGSAQSRATPFTQSWVVNSQMQMSAPAQQTQGTTTYQFSKWSDNGARTHTVTVPASNTTYTATYTALSCSGPSYRSAVLADAPATYWRLAETGPSAWDITFNGNNATYNGGVTQGVAGALAGDSNAAIQLDGNNDYVIRNPMANFPTTAITTELWIRTSDTTKDAGILTYASANDVDDWGLRDARNLRITENGAFVTTGVALNDGNWHHVAVTWRSSDGATVVYKDGAPVWLGVLHPGVPITTGGAVVLGQEQDAIGGGFDVNQAYLGQLDDVAVYPTFLSAAKVKAHYAARTGTC
jgi:glucose/arabinose dehydrogenase/PKD repeat protein